MSYSSINRVVLVGRLTRDPELHALSPERSVCDLRIACSGIKREGDGEYAERPNYFDVSVFGPQAENVQRYTKKGRRVAIDGRLEWREWETEEQQRRQAVKIVADSVQFLDGPGEEHEQWSAQGVDPNELVGAGAGADVVF